LPDKRQLHPLPLLKSKLNPPLSGRFMVPRTRLDGWMKAADRTKLVLVRAPAGFGKTTLLVQWQERLKEQQQATAWLSLDDADNDPGRVQYSLIAAQQKIDPAFYIPKLVVG
jgi:ATP/maltotriose-dependent transcriptional regulator MalT